MSESTNDQGLAIDGLPMDGRSSDRAVVAGAPSDNTTLTAVLADLETAGYDASFGAREGVRLHCSVCRVESPVASFELDGVRRLEGASDPDAEMLVVAAICPSCGSRGTAVFGYGPDSSAIDSDAVSALDLRSSAD